MTGEGAAATSFLLDLDCASETRSGRVEPEFRGVIATDVEDVVASDFGHELGRDAPAELLVTVVGIGVTGIHRRDEEPFTRVVRKVWTAGQDGNGGAVPRVVGFKQCEAI